MSGGRSSSSQHQLCGCRGRRSRRRALPLSTIAVLMCAPLNMRLRECERAMCADRLVNHLELSVLSRQNRQLGRSGTKYKRRTILHLRFELTIVLTRSVFGTVPTKPTIRIMLRKHEWAPCRSRPEQCWNMHHFTQKSYNSLVSRHVSVVDHNVRRKGRHFSTSAL